MPCLCLKFLSVQLCHSIINFHNTSHTLRPTVHHIPTMSAAIADLQYIHLSLCIPPHAMGYLLPDPSLSVLEFLEFKLPIISSSKVLAPANFFSKLEPTITASDLLYGI